MKKFVNRYLIDGLSGMAGGLFSTLIIGLIIKQIGVLINSQLLLSLASICTVLTGIGIAIGTAYKLGAKPLVLYASALNGLVGAYAVGFLNGTLIQNGTIVLSGTGEPLGAFIATIVGVEVGNYISGKTKIDILITPAVTILSGSAAGLLVGPTISNFMFMLGEIIEAATILQPFLMGIVISVLMGIFLTLPISSAAISIILGLSGIAAGASTVGCCSQMIGFAIISFKDNGIDGLFAQGLGTSMLQIPNIVKNPKIWIPSILTSAILGPLSTVVFKLENVASGAGMGTSGLVGPLLAWEATTGSSFEKGIAILLLCFILPAILNFIIYKFMYNKGLIKDGDMKL
ncbi:MAG: PTS sugar transporter subunit IIC [Epulopiscium sp. Nele67-Bin005]|nr:MAG: PTS sugar transporter subunit IIC [Epulopiscium sp. Nele67-Bin005]